MYTHIKKKNYVIISKPSPEMPWRTNPNPWNIQPPKLQVREAAFHRIELLVLSAIPWTPKHDNTWQAFPHQFGSIHKWNLNQVAAIFCILKTCENINNKHPAHMNRYVSNKWLKHVESYIFVLRTTSTHQYPACHVLIYQGSLKATSAANRRILTNLKHKH